MSTFTVHVLYRRTYIEEQIINENLKVVKTYMSVNFSLWSIFCITWEELEPPPPLIAQASLKLTYPPSCCSLLRSWDHRSAHWTYSALKTMIKKEDDTLQKHPLWPTKAQLSNHVILYNRVSHFRFRTLL